MDGRNDGLWLDSVVDGGFEDGGFVVWEFEGDGLKGFDRLGEGGQGSGGLGGGGGLQGEVGDDDFGG